MKKYLLFFLIFAVLLLFNGCEDNSTEADNDITINEQSGEIGEQGGIVQITEEESDLNGTTITIPEGAIEGEVEISIEEVTDTGDIDMTMIDTTAVIVDFQPSGYEFLQPVEIGIPYTENTDIESMQIYTFDEGEEMWKALPIDHIDTVNMIAYTKTTHFSLYVSGDYADEYDVELYKVGSNRIAMKIQAQKLSQISPNLLTIASTGCFNLLELLENVDINQFFAWYKISIEEDSWFFPEIYQFDWYYYSGQAGAWNMFTPQIHKNQEGLFWQYSGNQFSYFDDETEDFFRGDAFVFISDPLPTDEDFRISVDQCYSEVNAPNLAFCLLARYTENHGFSITGINFSDLETLPESIDSDQNGITNSFDTPETDPVIVIVAPSGTQSGNITVNYNITDEDGDLNEFGIYYQSTQTGSNLASIANTSTGSIHQTGFIQDIESGDQSFIWNSTQDIPDVSGQFKIIMSWVDPEGGMPGPDFESEYFQVDNTSTTNQPPNPPSNPNPEDNATSVSINTYLSWTCTDPDPQDILTYDVYFGDSSNPQIVSNGQSNNTYYPDELDYETTYYWKIIAHDDNANSTTGGIWEFTTTGDGQQPPNLPSNPSPSNYATQISINSDLSWECSDPNGDPLTYDVYFGDSSNPQIVSNVQSNNTFDPDELDCETTYYWKIIAHDDHANSTTGDIWEFTTAGDTEPPFIGDIYIPEPGTTVSGIVTIETYATDNVSVNHVVFEVYRNGIGYEEVGIDYSPDNNDHFSIDFDSGLFENGEHNIHATAYDIADNSEMAGWSVNFSNNGQPNQPCNPSPDDNDISVSISTILSWECSDPNGDPLTYDVYYGTESDPPLVSSEQGNTSYDPGTMQYETIYYWKITASDGEYETEGDVWSFTTNEEGNYGDMIFVQGGSFEMGDHFNEGDSDELPVHTVTLNSFYIGQYEVTHTEYIEFLNSYGVSSDGSYNGTELIDMGDSDCAVDYNGSFYFSESSYASEPECPVIEVTWYGGIVYCNWLSEQEGLTPCYDTSDWSCDFGANGYRLPTEAEWEYAARGGINWEDNYRYSGTTDNLGEYAWYGSNSGSQTHEVGTKLPNQLDIYDMSGNVWEWCNDWYGSSYYGSSPEDNPVGPDSGSIRVRRGGSWGTDAGVCRVANRDGYYPGSSGGVVGFRILRAYSY